MKTSVHVVIIYETPEDEILAERNGVTRDTYLDAAYSYEEVLIKEGYYMNILNPWVPYSSFPCLGNIRWVRDDRIRIINFGMKFV